MLRRLKPIQRQFEIAELAGVAGEVVRDGLVLRELPTHRLEQVKRFAAALEVKQSVGLVDPAGRVVGVTLRHDTTYLCTALPVLVAGVDVPLEMQHLVVFPVLSRYL